MTSFIEGQAPVLFARESTASKLVFTGKRFAFNGVFALQAPVIRSKIMSPFRPASGVLTSRPFSRASSLSSSHGRLVPQYNSYSTDVSPQTRFTEVGTADTREPIPVRRNLVDHLDDARSESFETHTIVATSGKPSNLLQSHAHVSQTPLSHSSSSSGYSKPTPIKYYNENCDPTELADQTSPSNQAESRAKKVAPAGVSPQRYKMPANRSKYRNRLAVVPENQRSNRSLHSNTSIYDKRVTRSRSPYGSPSKTHKGISKRLVGRGGSRSPARPVVRLVFFGALHSYSVL